MILARVWWQTAGIIAATGVTAVALVAVGYLCGTNRKGGGRAP